MRVVLLEYFSSLPRGTAPPELRRAGRALRDAAAADLEAAAPIDLRILGVGPRPEARLRRALAGADGALIIAPESGGILHRLVRVVERAGVPHLGPGSRSVRLAGDKGACARCLSRAGVPVPVGSTLRARGAAGVSATRIAARLRRRRYPFVLKPADGCGSQGLTVVRRETEVPRAIRRARRATATGLLRAEDLARGRPASVSFLVRDGARDARDVLLLSLNRQRLAGRAALRYLGGRTPWNPRGAAAAIAAARAAVLAVQRASGDLRGYVGVDVVVGRRGPRVIEVNPRLTTSWLGVRRVVRGRPGLLLMMAAAGRPVPRRVRRRGVARFDAAGGVR